MCVHGALQWTGVPSSVNFCLAPYVPGIGSGSTVTLTRKKQLLKMNEQCALYFKKQTVLFSTSNQNVPELPERHYWPLDKVLNRRYILFHLEVVLDKNHLSNK